MDGSNRIKAKVINKNIGILISFQWSLEEILKGNCAN